MTLREDEIRAQCQVSQALTAKEDSTWSFGVYLTHSLSCPVLRIMALGPGLCDQDLSLAARVSNQLWFK